MSALANAHYQKNKNILKRMLYAYTNYTVSKIISQTKIFLNYY